MDQDSLEAKIAALLGPDLRPQRRRGRPRDGFRKADLYAKQVEELVRSGMNPWSAVKEVAKRNRKTPEHISACRKMVNDAEYFSSFEDYFRENPDD